MLAPDRQEVTLHVRGWSSGSGVFKSNTPEGSRQNSSSVEDKPKEQTQEEKKPGSRSESDLFYHLVPGVHMHGEA